MQNQDQGTTRIEETFTFKTRHSSNLSLSSLYNENLMKEFTLVRELQRQKRIGEKQKGFNLVESNPE